VGRFLVAFVACLACLGCGPSHALVPSPPTDVQALAAEYDDPTGTVPVQAMAQIEELQQDVGTIDATGFISVVGDLLAAVEKRVADSGLPTDPLAQPKKHRPVISGSITFTRTCKGWDDASTTPDPANGSITATVVFQNGVLQRTIWGTATTCHERVPGPGGTTIHALFDGTLTVYLEGPLESDTAKGTYLVVWSGSIGTQAASVPLAFDFRVVPPNVEVRIPLGDGSIIGSIGSSGVSLRGANGTFTCSADTFTCIMPAS
jgi:hypothetical protein